MAKCRCTCSIWITDLCCNALHWFRLNKLKSAKTKYFGSDWIWTHSLQPGGPEATRWASHVNGIELRLCSTECAFVRAARRPLSAVRFSSKIVEKWFFARGAPAPRARGELFGELFHTLLTSFQPPGSFQKNFISPKVSEFFLNFARVGIAPPVLAPIIFSLGDAIELGPS